MPALIGLLISLIILALVLWLIWWIINWILSAIPNIPAPIGVIVRVLFGVICLVAVLSLLFGGWSFPFAGFYHR